MKIVWVKIIPLTYGYLVKCRMKSTASQFKTDYDFQELQQHAFEKFEDVEKFIKKHIK